MSTNEISADLLVVGAGIAGITAAVEAAETGLSVILVEKRPYIGGKVAQFSKYFPKLCPPACGLEINIRRLRSNPLIRLYTMAEVSTNILNDSGKHEVNIHLKPRYVNNKCTACGECIKVCQGRRKNEFNFNMDETTCIYIPYENAYPQKYIIDKKNCEGRCCSKCAEVCKYGAIDLEDEGAVIPAVVDSIIWAAGWEPYDAKNLDVLGFGRFPDVITNVMMERLASPDGPTKGKILRPSTNEKINSVAFVQCAGSRDENHLEYCSSVCCMASLKHTKYVREQYPDAEVHFHYIDVRASGMLEDFYRSIQSDNKVHFHKGKVGKVTGSDSGKLIVHSEDTLTGKLIQNEVELVVLATGMKPSTAGLPIESSAIDKNGFISFNDSLSNQSSGLTGCGVITEPKDVASAVQEATGSILKAIRTIKRN